MAEKLCAYCKINPATNRYAKQTQEGTVTEYYCLACYRKVRDLAEKTVEIPEEIEIEHLSKCPNCGCTIEQFKKTILVGCEHCYKALSWAIEPVIERMQGSSKPHCGKEQILTDKERLTRRGNAISVILAKKTDRQEAEIYEEELLRIQMLLSNDEEEV